MTQEFVTLPREVVELALEALNNSTIGGRSIQLMHKKGLTVDALRAALDQPKNHIEQHLGMVPAGWKLVPVVPTREMLAAACRDGVEINGRPVWKHTVDVQAAWRWGQMLDAAPQPPVVERPQAEQPTMTPIAQRKLDSLLAEGYTISGYSIYHKQKHQHGFVTGAGLVGWWKPEGMEYPQPLGEQEPVAFAIFTEAGNARMWSTFQPHVQKLADAEWLTVTPLYTRPQPKREPLTDEEIDKLCPQFDDPMRREMWIIGFKAAHNIK